MKFQQLFKSSFAVLIALMFAGALTAIAQDGRPTLVVADQKREMPLAGPNNLYCAGYVQTDPVNTTMRIVGSENEQEQYVFSQGNNLYVNAGAGKGVRVGDLFAIVRPRGQVETRWTKKEDLGFYVQEVGALEVIRVKQDVSVVRVKTSCDTIQFGDLLQPIPERTSPMFVERPALDVFADPSGKATGRIFLARDARELLSREQIVYVDLGAEDGVKSGDYLTIFRPLGTGGITPYSQKETVSARDEGFQSDEFRGGKFSNQAARKKGDETRGRVQTTADAKLDRPSDLRKIVGELVILSVRGKTATAMIVRAAQEIHTGDWVELQ